VALRKQAATLVKIDPEARNCFSAHVLHRNTSYALNILKFDQRLAKIGWGFSLQSIKRLSQKYS
jgi:hypothetical protein